MPDPFAHLDIEQIQAAERKYRAQHPVLWWVAKFVVFVRGPTKWVRSWLERKCGEMDSCEEARFYLEECGIKRLDGDKDGVPCESLCR